MPPGQAASTKPRESLTSILEEELGEIFATKLIIAKVSKDSAYTRILEAMKLLGHGLDDKEEEKEGKREGGKGGR